MPSLLRYLRNVDVRKLSLVPKGANKRRIFLYKSAGDGGSELAPGRIIKADDDWSSFYIVVAEPGAEEEPGQGPHESGTIDVWESEDEIRKAAHRFMANGGIVNAMHEDLDGIGRIVENAIALADFDVGEETIRKGSWYVAIEPSGEGREKVASGEWSAVSIEGFGERVEKEAEQPAVTATSATPTATTYNVSTTSVTDDATLLQRIARALGIGVEKEEGEPCGCGHHHEVAEDESDMTHTEVEKAPLDAAARKRIPRSSFVFPDKAPGPGSYPIHDRAHGANALARASGKPEEAAVRRAVCSRYGDLPACEQMRKQGLLGDFGTFETTEEEAEVELNERVEKVEEKLEKLAETVEPLAKLPEAIEKLAERIPEKEEKEVSVSEGIEKIAATQADVQKMQGELDEALVAINKRVEALAEGQSTQTDERRVEKADPPAGDLTGLLS